MLVQVACAECLKFRGQADAVVLLVDDLPRTLEMQCPYHGRSEAYPLLAMPNVAQS